MTSRTHQMLLLASAVLTPVTCSFAEPGGATAPPKGSPDGVWERVERVEAGRAPVWLRPGRFKAFKLNHGALQRVVAQAPKEFSDEARRVHTELRLPMPDGSFARFRIVESPIMEPELAAKFPQLKTYSGQGVDDPTATVRLDTSPRGLHAHVRSAQGTSQVDPAAEGDLQTHVSYDLRDAVAGSDPFECQAEAPPAEAAAVQAPLQPATAESSTASIVPSAEVKLRIFRLALAVTGEWTQLHGGTVEAAMSSMLSTVNRINAIFEAELAIRLVLVANNDLLIHLDPATDPYTLAPGSTRDMQASQNQTNVHQVIGPANYDIGHVFDQGFGGVAWISGVCVDERKAQAASGFHGPAEDPWFLHIAAHEIGHQFGANHTLNGLCSSPSGVGTPHAPCCAFEPGSGTTIMSYAKAVVCGADYLIVTNSYSDLYFHSGSLDAMNNFVSDTASCRVLAATGNNPPTVSAGGNFTIPARTPFVLTATGSDPDGDTLTYCWEQRDLGPRQPLSGPGSEDNGSSPLFRSFPPTPNPSRIFPRITDILENARTIGEQLPTRNRTLHFRVTARDNRAGGGGTAGADMQVTVISNAGPFVITSPNSAGPLSGTTTVTWDVAGTTNSPINASRVNILLSTNGGYDFPITLAANIPNDGSETVSLPDLFITEGRIKVEAADDIFFHISNPNFTVVPAAAPMIVPSGTSLLSEGCAPANAAIDPGETVSLGFVLANTGGAAATNLIVSLQPSADLLSPSGPQTNGLLASGGRATNVFSFTAASELPCGGTITATLRLQDGPKELGYLDYSLGVGRTMLLTSRFANTNTIVSPTNAPISPYPSTITVSNLAGTVSQVTVTLSNFTYADVRLFQIMLVGPQGQAILLFDTGISPRGVTNATLTFDDAAALSLLDVADITSGSYRPTPGLNLFPLPPPAPAQPNATGLSAFFGTNPNGTWRLFLVTRRIVSGTVASGWSLSLITSNTACCNPLGLAVAQEESSDPILMNANLTYTITVTNVGASAASGVTLSDPLPGGVSFVSASTSQGACLHNAGTVTCDFGTLVAGSLATATIVVTPTVPGTLTNTVSVTHADAAGAPPAVARALTTVQAPRAISIADITVTEGDSGTNTVQLQLFLSDPSTEPVSVRFATVPGTAEAGADFVATNGVVTFAAQESVAAISLRVLGDRLSEAHETFFVELSEPTNAELANSQSRVTILDDDPLISISGGSVTEGNTGTRGASFTVTATNLGAKSVTLSYATSNQTATAGSDYGPTSGTLTLSPSRRSTNIVVVIGGDTLVESDEIFLLVFATPTNATLAANTVAGNILNDDGLPGQVDHLVWSPVASPQYAGLAFPVTLTARDAAENTAANFTGTVALSAFGPPQQTVIGTNTATWNYPFNTAAHDARLQSIYLASEVGGPALITGLALDVATPPGQTLSNWTIRLKHTPMTNYAAPAAWEFSDWTTVYQADQNITSTGWVEFVFAAPFAYNGSNHLMVDFSFDNASSSSAGLCRYRTVSGGSRSVAAQANSTLGNPLLWSGTSLPGPSPTTRIPNVRLMVKPSVPLVPPIGGPFTGGLWVGEIAVLQPATDVTLRADDGDGHFGLSGVFSVAVAPLRLEPLALDQGSFRFLLHGQAGLSVRVQRSTNLQDWQDWQAVTLGTAPSELSDPDGGAIRFYRAVQP